MIIALIKNGGALIPLIVALGVWGCASQPRFYLPYGSEFKQARLEEILAENPLGAAENIKITTLGQGRNVSHHIVQIRDRETPHLHKNHDGTVVMMKGRGYLMLRDRRIELSAGDVIYIPRGAPHFFVNTSGEPAVAFVIFSPPFDGKDSVPVPVVGQQ